MNLEPKFFIGQRVWLCRPERVLRKHDCPDCLGLKVWKTTSPAGANYEFSCPRCSAGYTANGDLSLEYWAYAPNARPLTIGSVRYDSNSDSLFTYMCKETGVGSGSVYSENELCETEADALEVSAILADKKNKSEPNIVERMTKTISLSDYQLYHIKDKEAV